MRYLLVEVLELSTTHSDTQSRARHLFGMNDQVLALDRFSVAR